MLYQTTVQVPELSQDDLIDGGVHRESHAETDFKLEKETRPQSPVATAGRAVPVWWRGEERRGAAMTSWGRRARLLGESASVPSTRSIRGARCAHPSAGKTVESLSSAEAHQGRLTFHTCRATVSCSQRVLVDRPADAVEVGKVCRRKKCSVGRCSFCLLFNHTQVYKKKLW